MRRVKKKEKNIIQMLKVISQQRYYCASCTFCIEIDKKHYFCSITHIFSIALNFCLPFFSYPTSRLRQHLPE